MRTMDRREAELCYGITTSVQNLLGLHYLWIGGGRVSRGELVGFSVTLLTPLNKKSM